MNYLSNQPYKGTRDFFPEDMLLRNWLFSKMRKVIEKYAYEEYDGPILESFDLYKIKSSEEIVEKQLYYFTDKGNRQVAIRPEMTPTLARMVSRKMREYQKPIRWFSIPNVWRYEQPSKGRLREHWQLNVDIFGIDGIEAESEIFMIAIKILENFGAQKTHYKLKFSHRGILESFLSNTIGLNHSQKKLVSKILDKKDKISSDEFKDEISKLLIYPKEQISLIYQFLKADINQLQDVDGIDVKCIDNVKKLLYILEKLDIKEQVEFDTSIVRGFDYYTGIVFEIFDIDIENKRSIYGGGRYDNLVNLFSKQNLSGVGFGLGDVTLQNFLKSHSLLPKFSFENSLYFVLIEEQDYIFNLQIAEVLRKNNIRIELSLKVDKLGKQIQIAEKKGYRYVLIYGSKERESNILIIKDLRLKEQKQTHIQTLIESFKKMEDLKLSLGADDFLFCDLPSLIRMF